MKLNYVRPEAIVIVPLYRDSLLLSDSETARNAGGGVTEGTGGISTNIGETSETTPGYGYGQNEPDNPIGGGNRAKGNNLWDDWE